MRAHSATFPAGPLDRVRQAFAAVEAHVLAAAAMAAGCVWGLIALGGEMREGETSAFDRHLMLALREPGQPHQPVGPTWLTDTLRDVTALGGTTIIALATLVAAAALSFHRRWRRAAVLVLVIVASNLCDDTLKELYHRARPDFAAPGVFSHAESFPSGHSTASVALWLSLAMIAASFERRRQAKSFWFAVATAMIVTVGFSRVYLGVHWPTDVFAGWMLGAVWALSGWALWHSLRPEWRGELRLEAAP